MTLVMLAGIPVFWYFARQRSRTKQQARSKLKTPATLIPARKKVTGPSCETLIAIPNLLAAIERRASSALDE